MRLLIVTQKIDEKDAVLGFMHGWVSEFAKQVESVVVICLEKGQVNLPENVKVFSLGKEKSNLQFSIYNFQLITNFKIFKKIKYAWRFVRYIVQMRNEYDAVLVHMNPEYILLGGIFWKLFGKTVTLWYVHKSVPWFLRIAHLFTDIVFTSTASGFRLTSQHGRLTGHQGGKVQVVGQGIDTEKFKSPLRRPAEEAGFKIQDSRFKNGDRKFRIVTVGRITPSKDYGTLIDAVEKVCRDVTMPIEVAIVGPTSITSDEAYLAELKKKVSQKSLSGVISFFPPVANSELPETLSRYDLFVNMGHTGSLDKAVPEAMAVGMPILTCNEAFKEVLGPFTGDLMYPKGDASALSGRIKRIMDLSEKDRRTLGGALRDIVIRDHSLKSFVNKIIIEIEAYKKHVRQ